MPRINVDMGRVSGWFNFKCCFSLLAAAALLFMIIGSFHANHREKSPFLAPQPQPPLSPVPQPAPRADAIVAKDGTGHFLTISEAVETAPYYSLHRYRIHIKGGRYEENVRVGPGKTNLMFIGDGMNDTIITGNRSVADRWYVSETPTVDVEGDGFVAVDLTVENAADPSKGFALELRSQSNEAAFYRCRFSGYYGTLQANGGKQFFKDCIIEGSHLLLHGDAAALFQTCALQVRTPVPRQIKSAILTGHKRQLRFISRGFSIQNCSVVRAPDYDHRHSGQVFLGRALGPAARVVFLQSYLEEIVSPGGWIGWGEGSHPDCTALNAAYFGEYLNYGPGADIRRRNRSSGFVAINTATEALNYTLVPFINGTAWLPETGVPCQTGLRPIKN